MSFTEPLIVEVLDDDDRPFRVFKQLIYHVGTYPSDELIIVPEGFRTDFATVPRGFRFLIDRVGVHSKACLIHDVIVAYELRSRKEADHIFFEALTVLKVSPIRKWTMYLAVRSMGVYKTFFRLPPRLP